MRRFEFSDSTSNKFWEVDVKGETLNVTFGKIGTKGQSKPKDFATPEKAKAEMEKLIKEKTSKGYVEVGGKAVKPAAKSSAAKSPVTKPAAKPPASKKANPGSVGEGLSKAEKQAKAEKVLAMFKGGQWELARGILEAAQDEHWLFEELLEGCKIDKYGRHIPSKKIMDAFEEEETSVNWHDSNVYEIEVRPVKSELLMLEVLLHLPKDLKKFQKLQKLQNELLVKLGADILHILPKYWKEVVRGEFKGVKYSDPVFFTDQWYEERKIEIANVEKECEARSKALNKVWREEEDLGNGIKLEMMLIPAGKFMMGSPESETSEYDYATRHEVTLTKPFYLGKFAVTQEQWEGVMGDNPSETKGAKLPVTDVSWDDCQEFIKKLNGITKGKYRLPTEAEWEYACRAGTSTAYSFGVNITPKDANSSESEIGKPVEVGSYKPNAFGLYDMHGNVWEWCEDWYGDYPKGAVIDPKGPATGEYRVLRGGSFEYSEYRERNIDIKVLFAESRSRLYLRYPTDWFNLLGLRLARTAL
jgi:formylglycine-generating enzyme required for sulfatase activity/predicted DNA-binding WGR domain protein